MLLYSYGPVVRMLMVFVASHGLISVLCVSIDTNRNVINSQLNTLTPVTSLTSKAIPMLTSEPPLKILLCVEPTPFNYISGYSNRFKEMLKYLKKANDEVVIISPDRTTYNKPPQIRPPEEHLGYKVISPRGWEFPFYKQVTLTYDFKFNIPKVIRSFAPDLIHVSTPSSVVIPAVIWSRLLNIPLVISYHTDLAGYANTSYIPTAARTMSVKLAYFLIRFFHKDADLVLCTSPQLKQQMQWLGLTRIDVWQKGINTEIFSPKFRNAEMRTKLSQGHSDAPLLLYVGRLGLEKSLDKLKRVLDRMPTARLALVGTGPYEDKLKAVFKDYPGVYFAGQMVGVELSQAYASCDVFVMPSETETLGFVVMEAMASGLPVIGARAGGLIDLIEHDKTGYLVTPNEDMVEFTDCVKKVVDSIEIRARMSEEALQWSQQWSWEAATSKLRNIQYQKALRLHRLARDDQGRYIRDIEAAIMDS